MTRTGNTTADGYGYEHQQLRKVLLEEAYGQPCVHCQLVMLPGQKLDLDHTADRTAYRGMAHASCNRSEGARRGNALRRRRSKALKTSEAW
ncbi:endonuclease domain-containing protein [Streptomyces sp. NPDC101455]|uniref:endonuclease domain-containing protein n=1 Tax=Streptomyces sp. NPDC101455 TaxID=3366142 RepID=UPI003809E7D1